MHIFLIIVQYERSVLDAQSLLFQFPTLLLKQKEAQIRTQKGAVASLHLSCFGVWISAFRICQSTGSVSSFCMHALPLVLKMAEEESTATAPKVAKKGEKRAGKKGGKIGGAGEKKRKRKDDGCECE